MKMCLKCFCLWPRDAIYCGKCRLPLGTKRCPKGHANSLHTPGQTCTTCNEGPLTPGVAVLPLSGLASLLALLLLVFAWRWTWHHPGVVICAAWRAGLWTLGLLFGTSPRRVHGALYGALAWYVALWLLSYILPGATGKAARQTLRALPRLLWRGLHSGLKALRPLLLLPARAVKGKVGAARPKDGDTNAS